MRQHWDNLIKKSEENFLIDSLGRSSCLSGWFMYGGEDVAFKAKQLLDSNNELAEYFRCLYLKAYSQIKRNLSIIKADGEKVSLETLAFDMRYGWIGTDGEEEVYLGKVVYQEEGEILVGRQTYLAGSSLLRGPATIRVGAFCSIGESLFIMAGPDRHPTKTVSSFNFKSHPRDVGKKYFMELGYDEIQEENNDVIIGNDVWIGREVNIQPGSEIGDGCIIGEGSLVRGTLEPYGVYAGTPAKLKKYRFSETVREQLLEIRWWNWSKTRLVQNQNFFSTDLTKYIGKLSELMTREI